MIKFRTSPPGSARGPFFHKMRMLLAPEGSGGGGGGGGGGGSGGADQGLNQQAIDQINAIVTAKLQKFDFSGPINSALEKAMTPLTDKLTASVAELVGKATAAQPPAGDKGKDKGKEGGQDDATKNELAQLKASIEQLQSDNKRKDQALAQAALDARNKTVGDKFNTALQGLKIRPELTEAAQMAVAKRAGEITWDKDEPKVKVKRDKFGQQYEELISPEAYAKEWGETPEGKGFITAPGGKPTGGKVQGGTRIVPGQQQGQPGQQGANGGQQQQRPRGVSDDALGRMVISAYAGDGAAGAAAGENE